MFKRLRERIAEEATKFPVGQDLITLSDSSSVVVPHTSPQQFSIGEEEDGSLSEQSTPQKKQNTQSGGTETSYGSKDHHSSGFTDLGFGQEYRPSKKLSYVPQSDIESEREDPPTLNLDGISKDQLMTAIQSLKAKSYKYRNKYAEVVKNYKELREEKIKIENTLIENQDKGLRRIAELREQCQLEQKAKAHLEENLRLLLEEKDSRICVLETQINLLKEGGKSSSTKTLPEDCDNQCSDAGSGDTRSEDSITSACSDISALQEKVERLQHQHNQDKKTINSQKDQISLLRKQNENLSQELEEKMKRLNTVEDEQSKLKSEHETVLKNMQDRLKELEKQQEESIMSMAETKKNMHEELELKEKQLIKAEEESKLYQTAAEHEKEVIADLKKQHEERVNELLRQLEMTEKTLEEEKQSLLHDLAQGKTAAINLMQQECAKKIAAVQEEWKLKFEALQSASEKSSQAQVEELSNSLNNTKEKLKQAEQRVGELDSLGSVLEKENVSLKNSVEKLESEVALSRANYEKLKVSYSDYDSLKEKELLLRNQEALNIELNDKISKYISTEKELQTLCDTLSQQLEDQKVIIKNLENDKNDLNDKIKSYEASQKDLGSTCDNLKSEISVLNQNLKSHEHRLESLTLENNDKTKKIINLQTQLEKAQLNEKLLCEKLDLSLTETKEYESENAELLLNSRLLSDEIQNLKNSLISKEKELESINANFSKAHDEVSMLQDALEMKESMYKQALINYKQVESLVSSLEQQQNCMKMTITNFQNICQSVIENSNFISEKFQSIDKNHFAADKIFANKSCNTSDNSIYFSANKNIDAKNISEENLQVCNAQKDLTESENGNESSSMDSLFHELILLKKENADLKEELCACKSSSELQNIEFAKNITMLHQSLSDLQEERNNLSLVLQNLENTQSEKNSHTSENEMQCAIKEKTENSDYVCNWETRIAELNSKVKLEIETLSSQTEMVNKELKCLHEKFKSSQGSYSEKLNELNVKLLLRTETIISLKEDLEASIENANNLQELVEKLKHEVDEKTELLKSVESSKKELENKCKSLKEKYLKKECELKETHNSQLIDLKNQTKLTIDKLNEQVKQSNKLLKEKEDELNMKLASAEQNYQKVIFDFQSQIEEVMNCQINLNKLSDISSTFETKISDCSFKLDAYCLKITNLGSKVNQFLSKLKEKDEKINQQNNTLQSLNEELKGYAEVRKAFNNIQNELNSTTKLLQDTNNELNNEKEKLKSFEAVHSKLKSEFELAIQENKVLSTSNADKEKLQLLLNAAVQELENLKATYSETCSCLKNQATELQELQEKSNCMSKELDGEKEKLRLCETEKSELKDSYETAVLEIKQLSSKMNQLSSEISNKDKMQLLLESMSLELESLKTKYSETLSDLNNQITECKFLQENYESVRKELELDKEKLKSLETENSRLKADHDAALQKIKDISSTNISDQEKLQSSLTARTQELESIKAMHSETASVLNNQLQELQKMHETVCKELETEKEKLKLCKEENTKLKVDYETLLREIKQLSASISDKDQIQTLLKDTTQELESLKIKYSETYSSLNEQATQLKALQEKYTCALNDIDKLNKTVEDQKFYLEQQNVEACELSKKYKDVTSQIDEICTKWKDFVEKTNILLDQKDNQIKNIQSELSIISSEYGLKVQEVSDLKSELDVSSKNLTGIKSLLEEKERELKNSNDSITEWKSKYESAISKVEEITSSSENSVSQLNMLVEEKETQLNNTKYKLTEIEDDFKKLKLEADHVPIIQDKLKKSEEELHNYQKLLNEHIEKITKMESEKLEWKQKYDTAFENLQNVSNSAAEDKERIQLLLSDIDAKTAQINSMISRDKLKEIEENYKVDMQKYKDQIQILHLEIKSLSQSLSEKENTIRSKDIEKENIEAHHEESLKCMKDKLQNAEKNHKTQMEEMKLKLSQLEKENSILISEKENLLVIQKQFKELKSESDKMQSDLKSKEEELKKLQEKFETTNKEQTEKIHTFQESMKDKENMILKLKASIESNNKEHSEMVEELHKKIKRLEVEREQLMLQAQERVSATEAKCREDIKTLQEKCDKLLLENSDIEKLRNQIGVLNSQLDESLLVAESNQVSASQEISLLKERLSSTERKLTEAEKSKLMFESELSTKLEKLQQENKLLLSNSDHVEKLKAEKEELNEKLKTAVQQVKKIKVLENERESLIKEKEELSKELKNMRTIENENDSIREKLKLLEENESIMKKKIEDLTSENEKLKSEILTLKNYFKSEKESLLTEKEKLQNRIQQLENCVSDPQNAPVKDYLETLKNEYEEAIKAKDDEMLSKLKQLVRDFSIQMDVKDKDSEQMISELIEKNQNLEEKLQREHAIEIAALRQDLFQKECSLDEMRDLYEESLQEKESKIKKLELTIKSLTPKDSTTAESSQNAAEHSDWDDSWVVPDEAIETSSPNHNTEASNEHVQQIETLQEELNKCNAEIKELKILLRLSPPDTIVNNNNRRDSLQSLPEPTEFEYLKNIIYEYMMGKEPVTLAKVIAAVLRFNDVQTQQVIRREEARHPTK